MKAHVQGRNGAPGSVSAFDAYPGFRDIGFEVEVFDGYSLGSYGLWHDLYAQLLSARWAELVGVDDPCNFGVAIPPMRGKLNMSDYLEEDSDVRRYAAEEDVGRLFAQA